jgi:hypothetical protein
MGFEKLTAADEEILAKCQGMNLIILATDKRLIFCKRFVFTEKLFDIPILSIRAVEVVKKSVYPPLTVAVASTMTALFIWGWLGFPKDPVPIHPHLTYIFLALNASAFTGFLMTVLRTFFSTLKIVARDGSDVINVKLVNLRDAEAIIKAVKG